MMSARPNVIENIVAADLCTGCGGCAALAPAKIKMQRSVDGFARPKTVGRLSHTQQREIGSICPGQSQSAFEHGAKEHPLWGSYTSIMEGWSSDAALRKAGASGGALSQVLISLIRAGQVDGVVQVKADPAHPLENQVVVNRDPAHVMTAAASRYAPSSPLAVVGELLAQKGRFAFVGKPCDVAALRIWALQDPRVDERFPVMLSFFCAGVPSHHGAKQVVEQLGVASDDVVRFSYRGGGWPGRTKVETRQGDMRSMRYQESWGGILSRHVQQRCRICADGIGLAADIAFADAWQTDSAGYPLFEEQEGRSVILARTPKGADIIAQSVRSSALETQDLSIEALKAMQPGQVRRRRELLGRLAGRILSGRPIPRYRGLGIWRLARQAGFRQTTLAMLGTARRGLAQYRSQT